MKNRLKRLIQIQSPFFRVLEERNEGSALDARDKEIVSERDDRR